MLHNDDSNNNKNQKDANLRGTKRQLTVQAQNMIIHQRTATAKVCYCLEWSSVTVLLVIFQCP